MCTMMKSPALTAATLLVMLCVTTESTNTVTATLQRVYQNQGRMKQMTPGGWQIKFNAFSQREEVKYRDPEITVDKDTCSLQIGDTSFPLMDETQLSNGKEEIKSERDILRGSWYFFLTIFGEAGHIGPGTVQFEFVGEKSQIHKIYEALKEVKLIRERHMREGCKERQAEKEKRRYEDYLRRDERAAKAAALDALTKSKALRSTSGQAKSKADALAAEVAAWVAEAEAKEQERKRREKADRTYNEFWKTITHPMEQPISAVMSGASSSDSGDDHVEPVEEPESTVTEQAVSSDSQNGDDHHYVESSSERYFRLRAEKLARELNLL